MHPGIRAIGTATWVWSIALAITAAGGLPPQAATSAEEMCNVVMDRVKTPVVSAGGAVLHGGSHPCPPALVEEVAIVEVVPAALPAEVLYFDFDHTDLPPAVREQLDAILPALSERQPAAIAISGHTDRAGPADYNQRLSERRAAAVAAALEEAGVASNKIQAQGFGETSPAVPTDDGVALQANRRVEISFAY